MKYSIIILLIGHFFVYSANLSAQETENHTDTNTIQLSHPIKAAKIIGVVLPSSMLVYGVLSFQVEGIRQIDYSVNNKYHKEPSIQNNGWDSYLRFTPAAAAFGMNIGGIESRHKLFDMAILYTLSNVLNAGVVYGAKNITTRERPDRSDNHSFPSGHASTAFVAAEFLHQEYKDKSIWISVGGYGIATLVSAARMYNNQHWVSDVVAGAGIGILSTKIAYWSYPYLQKAFRMKEKQFSTQMVPMYYDGKIGLNFVSTF
jgi:membrane-associated phospholipid phosphatase